MIECDGSCMWKLKGPCKIHLGERKAMNEKLALIRNRQSSRDQYHKARTEGKSSYVANRESVESNSIRHSSSKFGRTKEEAIRTAKSPCGFCEKIPNYPFEKSHSDHDHTCSKCGAFNKRLVRGKAICGKCGGYLRFRGP